MLENKEYSEITVLDLVADSNVNRNTFYYHFKDLDGLIPRLQDVQRTLASTPAKVMLPRSSVL